MTVPYDKIKIIGRIFIKFNSREQNFPLTKYVHYRKTKIKFGRKYAIFKNGAQEPTFGGVNWNYVIFNILLIMQILTILTFY